MCSFEQITQPESRTYFYGKSAKDFEGTADLIGMQLGRMQYINMKKESGKDTLYLTVINLDPTKQGIWPGRIQTSVIGFEIKINAQSILSCYSCNGGLRVDQGKSCICTDCPSGYYGEDCSIKMQVLKNGHKKRIQIKGPGQAFMRLEAQTDVSVIVKLSSGVAQAYFQFITFQGEFASYTNVAKSKSQRFQGRFLVIGGTSGTTIGAQTDDSTHMSLTVAVFDDSNVTVQAYFELKQESNILLIILGVLGSVLLFGLIIAACYIIRSTGYFNNGTENAHGNRHVRNLEQRLTDQEIDRFFPSVVFGQIKPSLPLSMAIIPRASLETHKTSNRTKAIFPENTTNSIIISKPGHIVKNNDSLQQPTLQNLHQRPSQRQQPQQQDQQDCVICLCPVGLSDLVKVTYCRHIFHAGCLIGWFRKQQNCPYCREQFNRLNTINLYRKIKNQIQYANSQHANKGLLKNNSFASNVIKGLDLVRAIMASRLSFVDSKNSIAEKQTNPVKVVSRNSVEIQSISSNSNDNESNSNNNNN